MGILKWTAERFTQRGIPSARLDAELLLAHCLGVSRLQLYLDHDKPMQEHELVAFRELVRRRQAREPLAYITGRREFWSLELEVTPAVLVPRPDSELLVEIALRFLGERAQGRLAVDVGTGSGALAVAIAHSRSGLRVHATDSFDQALALARRNAERHGVDVVFHSGDLLAPLPQALGPDLIVANLPYIPSAELSGLMPEVREWEPRAALDGGPDGLDVIRRLVPAAAERLVAGGMLALELAAGQAAAVCSLLAHSGFDAVEAQRDLGGIERVVSGLRSPAILP